MKRIHTRTIIENIKIKSLMLLKKRTVTILFYNSNSK